MKEFYEENENRTERSSEDITELSDGVIVDIENDPSGNGSKEVISDPEEPVKPFSSILSWTSWFVYSVVLVLVLNLFFFRSITVSGNSMNDTLMNNDKVFATNFLYTPDYGDVVVVEADKLQLQGTNIYGETIIKRIIAKEGDTIRVDFDNGKVYRNGELLEEDYIKEPIREYYTGWIENNKDYTVPEHCVFVMGDNRNNSNDSRNINDIGFIDTNLILGKAFVRYMPFSSFKWL